MVMRGQKATTPSKIALVLAAGKEQLSEEEYEKLQSLIVDFQIYGLSAYINTELGKIMSNVKWEMVEFESPEWGEALIACDRAFLGRELKDMCLDAGVSPDGHKKELCARLYQADVPAIVEIVEPYLENVENLPQTIPLYQSSLSEVKERLEEMHRIAPDEFHRRKQIIEQAIQERQRGKIRMMPQFTISELQEILRSANRLYR